MSDLIVWDNEFGDAVMIGTLTDNIKIFESGILISVFDDAGAYILATALREMHDSQDE